MFLKEQFHKTANEGLLTRQRQWTMLFLKEQCNDIVLKRTVAKTMLFLKEQFEKPAKISPYAKNGIQTKRASPGQQDLWCRN